MKPKSAGGCTKLKIPHPEDPNQWLTVTDPQVMGQELLKYCQNHFSNSFGTPFTIPPLSNILDYDGLSPFGQAILNGTADLSQLNLDNHTHLLLQHQQNCTPNYIPQFQEMPYKGLMQGFANGKNAPQHHLPADTLASTRPYSKMITNPKSKKPLRSNQTN